MLVREHRLVPELLEELGDGDRGRALLHVGLAGQEAAGQDVVEVGRLPLDRGTGRGRERRPLKPGVGPDGVGLGVVVEPVDRRLDRSAEEAVEALELEERGRENVRVLDVVIETTQDRDRDPVRLVLQDTIVHIGAGQLTEDRLGVLDGVELLEPVRRADPTAVEDVDRVVTHRILLAQVNDARGVGHAVHRAAAVVLVARDAAVENVAGNIRAQRHRELAAELLVAVEPERLKPGPGVGHQAGFLPVGGAREELELIGAARHAGDRLVRRILVAEELFPKIDVGRGRNDPTRELGVHPVLAAQAVPKRDIEHLLDRRKLAAAQSLERRLGPDPLGQVDPGSPARPALGPDDHHAVGGPAAVDRRRGRRLDDLDRLDLVRIDVGQPVDDSILVARGHTRLAGGERKGVQAARKAVVADDRAVQDEERLAVPKN